jgi:hypothetical protein
MKRWLLALFVLVPALATAAPAWVHRLSTQEAPNEVYDRVHKSLEAARS